MQELLSLKNILIHVVAPAISSLSFIYLWIKIFQIKDCHKNFKIYFISLFLIFLAIINNALIPQKFKIITFSLICIVIVVAFFNKKLDKAINSVITAQALAMISELIAVLLLSFIIDSNDITLFLQTNKGFLSVNILVGVIIIILTILNFSRKVYELLCKITDVIKKKKLIIYTILLICAADSLTYIIYYKININIVLVINTALIIVYSVITYHTVKIDNKFQGISNKYNLSLDTLRENENLLDDYKMYSHENSNTLKTIKYMIETNDKNLLNYVNTVINDKEKYDEGIIKDTSIIPISGLKALIYSKIKEMKKYNINNELYMDKSIKSTDLINVDDETLLDICKIVGVFLDNAIEATKELENKHINISLYKDNKNIIIEIANTFSNNIDFDKISKKGFTTKGGKHGYGLSLVKTILEHNKKLENTKQINNTIFIQALSIKI